MTWTTTPSANASLPLRQGGFASLRDALDYAAHGETGLNFFNARGECTDTLRYAELRRRALLLAHCWTRGPFKPGDLVALVADTSAAFLVHFYAAQYAGLVPCTLPSRGITASRADYVRNLRETLAPFPLAAIFAADGSFTTADRLAAPGTTVHGYGEEGSTALTGTEIAPMSPDIPAYIQFSSGSTAHPKGIVITQAALMHNVTGIATTGLRIGHDDRAFSWLPFYHDMGLVGFSIVALCAQRSVDYLSPTTFASRPMAWLKLMSAQRSSIVYAPGFAWRLAARCVRQEDVIDLGALRIAGVGGDMISAENLQECTSALAAVGLRPSAFQPGYGMAECTLAISMADPDLKPLIDHSTGTPYVGCGRPLPGLEVQVVDDAGRRLPEGGAGRIQVRGPSVTQHYYGASNEPSSGAEDGYFDTGDLGYMRAGEIFPTGRSKELIIVRGRNLWPQDIEREVGRLPGIAEGQVAAISVPGPFEEETLVLLLQRVPADAVQRAELAERVVESVNKAFGLAARVVFLPPNSLPVTSSGKLARVVARNRYLAGEWRAHSEGNSEVEAHA